MKHINEHSSSSISRLIIWAAWLIASIFYAYQYILRVMPSIMMQDLMQQFNLDSAVYGQFSGVYYIGYALMHIPLGILLDRYGPKRIMSLCVVVTIIGLLPILLTEHWLYALIGRFLIGVGSSGAILSAFSIIRRLFGAQKFTRILSFTVTIGLIGAIYGGGPMNYLCSIWGYKFVTMSAAMFGIMLSIVAFIITPQFHVEKNVSIMSNVKEVFGSKMVWAVCILAGLMVGPLEGFADVWGKQFLQTVYHFDSTMAASLISAIFLGMCFGAPVLSYIGSKINNELLTIFISGMLMAICFMLLLFGNVNVIALIIMFATIGVCSAYQILAIFKASTYVHNSATGLTTAVANMIIMMFGYAFHSIIGMIVNYCGGMESQQAIFYGIAVIPITLFIGAIGFGAICLNESKQPVTAAVNG